VRSTEVWKQMWKHQSMVRKGKFDEPRLIKTP
jgi:hypothetical protein